MLGSNFSFVDKSKVSSHRVSLYARVYVRCLEFLWRKSLMSLSHVLELLKVGDMAPKRSPRPGFLPVNPDDLLSVDERRERIRLRRAAEGGPYPAAASAPVRASSAAQSSAGGAPGEGLDRVRATRSDFADVRNVVRGGRLAAVAGDPGTVEDMVTELRRDRDATSGRGTRDSLLRTWQQFHTNARALVGNTLAADSIPITAVSLEVVAVFFKRGGYRSYPNYLSAVKTVHVERGHAWSEQLEGIARWTTRSVLRGIGPARQSRPFRLSAVMALQCSDAPLVIGGPKFPLQAMMVGSMFLLREVELAGIAVEHVSLDAARQEVTVRLTSSKSDFMALGTSRTWGCICGVRTLPCPFHICSRVVASSLLASRGQGLSDSAALLVPLFATTALGVATKAKFVETFEAVAILLGLPTLPLQASRRTADTLYVCPERRHWQRMGSRSQRSGSSHATLERRS
jgi:hypothetical protein